MLEGSLECEVLRYSEGEEVSLCSWMAAKEEAGRGRVARGLDEAELIEGPVIASVCTAG